MHSYILQRSVHLFLRLTETSIILESFAFNSEPLPVVRQRDAKHDGSRGTHLTISQENFLCYFILHMQVSQSEASESTLNEKKNTSNSHLTYGGKERLSHLPRARNYRIRYSPSDFSNSNNITERKYTHIIQRENCKLK